MTLATRHEAMPPVPNRDSYWVIPEKFLAGEYPGAASRAETRAKLTQFLDADTEVFIDLTEALETLRPYAEDLQDLAQGSGRRVMHQRMPVRDFAAPTREHMAHILDAIDEAIDAGRRVYVHCWGGIAPRGLPTGTVVGCYLARHGLAPRDDILATIEGLRRDVSDAASPSPENDLQRDLVASWRLGE